MIDNIKYLINQVTNNDLEDSNPVVSRDNVVWSTFDGNDSEIYLYNGSQAIALTNNNLEDSNPAISGNNIAWSTFDGNDSEIYLYDGNQTTQLTNNIREDSNPVISGNNVVWSAFEGNNSELYLYDGSRTSKITDNNVDEIYYQISDDNIVWSAFDGNDLELYLYDGSQTIQLTDNEEDEYTFDISANKIVWSTFDGNDSEVYLYDGSKTIQLTDNNVEDSTPKISGEQVVWHSFNDSNSEIYLYDGDRTIQLTDNNIFDHSPQVAKDYVVWSSFDGNDYEINLYHDNQTIQLTDNEINDRDPIVSGNNVVWSAFDGNDSEIFSASLSINPPVVANPIGDITVDENAASQTIDLSNVFKDADGNKIAIAIKDNSNPLLVNTSFDGTNITLDFIAGMFGSGEITVEATANGEKVSDTFKINVNEIDTLPIVINPLEDLTFKETAFDQTIDLRQVFYDADGDEITFEVIENTNPDVVATSFNGADLNLEFAEDILGNSEITIEATANGKKVSDTFSITVNGDIPSLPEAEFPLIDVHRFYQYDRGFHLYTADSKEINYIKDKSATGELTYSYEAEKYRVLSDNRDSLTGEEIAGVKPIYRFFNTATGAHLYTMNEKEKNYVQQNLASYSFEGIKYYAFETAPQDIETVPVYRMFNTQSGTHLFSSDRKEVNYILENLPQFSMENNGDAAFYVFEL